MLKVDIALRLATHEEKEAVAAKAKEIHQLLTLVGYASLETVACLS